MIIRDVARNVFPKLCVLIVDNSRVQLTYISALTKYKHSVYLTQDVFLHELAILRPQFNNALYYMDDLLPIFLYYTKVNSLSIGQPQKTAIFSIRAFGIDQILFYK